MYGFDTGFVTHVKGWNEIRDTDRDLLWEHLVLDMLRVSFDNVFYWADKQKSEIDFVVKGEGNEVHTIECKINPDKYVVNAVKKFRGLYPKGKNFCFSPHVKSPYKIETGGTEVLILSVLDDESY